MRALFLPRARQLAFAVRAPHSILNVIQLLQFSRALCASFPYFVSNSGFPARACQDAAIQFAAIRRASGPAMAAREGEQNHPGWTPTPARCARRGFPLSRESSFKPLNSASFCTNRGRIQAQSKPPRPRPPAGIGVFGCAIRPSGHRGSRSSQRASSCWRRGLRA